MRSNPETEHSDRRATSWNLVLLVNLGVLACYLSKYRFSGAWSSFLRSNFETEHSDRRATSWKLVLWVNVGVFTELYIKIWVSRGVESLTGTVLAEK